MTDRVVVLGAGYAGASAIQVLERRLDDAEITWVSDREYHLVLHEVHRAIRDPAVRDAITIPRGDIASAETELRQGQVVDVDVEKRLVSLADDSTLDYDYLLVALGSKTAFYGVPGLAEHAHTLKGLDDALSIHDALEESVREATPADPARVVVGGAGLSGIQAAGEVAEYRDHNDAPIEIVLVEALEEIMPGRPSDLQERVRRMLESKDIDILTDDPITEATGERVHFDEREQEPHDILIWTGGITGQDALEGADVAANHNRVLTDKTFQTSDERVFAVGDSAIVDTEDVEVPPTAQAAWDGAKTAAANLVRARAGEALDAWTYTDKGTVLSIGEDAVAHDVMYMPVETFNSLPARVAKKAIAARWITSITSIRRALSAWPAL